MFIYVPGDRYFVDEIAAQRRMRPRKVRALVVFGIVLGAMLALWFSGLIRL